MKWWLPGRRQTDKTSGGQLADAQQEVEHARERLRVSHENVVVPLNRYADRNNFADLIAASLAQGWRDGPEHRPGGVR